MINIDGRRLRKRRLQLGLTQREVAKNIGATSALLRRLEEVGDVAHVTVSTMQRLLDELSLDWQDVGIGKPRTGRPSESYTAAVGALLHDHGKAMPIPDIAACLGVDLETATKAVAALDQLLRPCGMRTHRASTGVGIVADDAAAAERTGSPLEQARRATVLTLADIKLLFRIMNDEAYVPSLMSSPKRRINLQKLLNAALVAENGPMNLKLTSSARRTLGLN